VHHDDIRIEKIWLNIKEITCAVMINIGFGVYPIRFACYLYGWRGRKKYKMDAARNLIALTI
jgi:hypothetical protein